MQNPLVSIFISRLSILLQPKLFGPSVRLRMLTCSHLWSTKRKIFIPTGRNIYPCKDKAFSLQVESNLLARTGQTHQKYSWRLYSLFSYNQCITLTQISRISRKTHRYTRVCHPAANTRHSRQARAKRRAICEICEICVKISHLRDNVLMRPPCCKERMS